MSMFAGKKGDSKSIWKRGELGAKKTSSYTKNSNFSHESFGHMGHKHRISDNCVYKFTMFINSPQFTAC